MLAVIITTPGEFFKFEVQPCNDLLYSPQGFHALRHHLLADAITRDDGNLIGRHALSLILIVRATMTGASHLPRMGLLGSWFQTEAESFADHHAAMLPMVDAKCKRHSPRPP